MSKQKTKYVKHPVSAEEKQKLRDQGYKILDERFSPDYDPSKGRIVKSGGKTEDKE